MKNSRLAIVLATLTASARFAIAQNEDIVGERIPVPPPPDVLIDSPAGKSFSEQRIRLAAGEDQLRQAERALATTQQAMMLAQAKAGDAGKTLTIRKRMAEAVHRSGSRTLVIPKDAGDAKSFGEVEEDMKVMAHILDKAASDDKSARAMGIPVFGRISGALPQNLYLEGYGAVFFENVDYPLLPPPARGNDTDTKEKTNSEWEEARKEMARPTPPGGADPFAAAVETFEREFVWSGGGSSPYDADKIEELKNDLISTLKNVANIRKLKSDETVTVVVTGASAGGTGKTIKSRGSRPGPDRDEEVVIAEMTAGDRAPASVPPKLVLRVRKADAEAFQNGKLNLDEFRKKVTTMIY